MSFNQKEEKILKRAKEYQEHKKMFYQDQSNKDDL